MDQGFPHRHQHNKHPKESAIRSGKRIVQRLLCLQRPNDKMFRSFPDVYSTIEYVNRRIDRRPDAADG